MTWLARTAAGETPFARVFGLRPELYARYRDFDELFWRSRPVAPALLDLCRLRMAQILGCPARPRSDAGVGAAQWAALEGWRKDDSFAPVERACLHLAEKFLLDPHGVGDEDAAAVTLHLGDAGMVALVEALALFDGFLRFGAILGAEADGGERV